MRPTKRRRRRPAWRFVDDRGDEAAGGGGSGDPVAEAKRECTANFIGYYQKQRVIGADELRGFMASLRSPLPITFRFSALSSHAVIVAAARAEAEAMLLGRVALSRQQQVTQQQREARGLPPLPPPPAPAGVPRATRVRWRTAGSAGVEAWQLVGDGVDRASLRASRRPAVARVHRWLVTQANGGAIMRQELVSMLPVALLGVRPGHIVLDMCAAPGSKTSQLLDLVGEPGRGARSQAATAVSPPHVNFAGTCV